MFFMTRMVFFISTENISKADIRNPLSLFAHEVVFEIGYHHEKSLGHGDILHVHVHNTPGVEYHGQADKFVIKPGHPLYEKYKKLFKGVKQ